MTARRSLVLGGTAFIGRQLVESLLQRGDDVTLLNRGEHRAPAGVRLLRANRQDRAAMHAALAGRDWDLVFDVSASVQVTSVEDLGALVAQLDGHCGCYQFISSIAAYRMGHGAFPWTEDLPTTRSRTTGYSGHKAAVEVLLAERRARTGFPYTVIRPAGVYGPHNNIPDGEMAMFLRLGQRRPVLVPHGGLVCFPYGHVEDLVHAMLLAADAQCARGEIFNITADAVTALHFVRTLARIVGVEAEILLIPDDVLATLRAPWPFNHRFQQNVHAVLSIDKARRLLGFEPRYDFEAGHRHTYDWFLAQGYAHLREPLNDPVWNISWDFEREQALAAALRRA